MTTVANATPTIQTAIGAATVNNQVIPFMRSREVEFRAWNMRPGRLANFFFGTTNVTRFVQRGSRIVLDTANTAKALVTAVGDNLYCNSTHAFASSLGSSEGNAIWINEDYICVNVSAVGANTLGASDYTALGSLVYQASNVQSAYIAGNVTFEATVVYWNSSDQVLVLQPIAGNLTCNGTSTTNTAAWLWLSGGSKLVSANTLVQGNKFPVNAQIADLTNTANKFLVSAWDHRHGFISGLGTPNANCILATGTVPSDAVGNLVFITGQTGLGQVGQVLTVSGNVIYTNTAFSPVPQGNSTYSIGLPNVDLTGYIAGIYNLPSAGNVLFPCGSETFTITDTSIVDDPNQTMVATSTYIAQGYLGAGKSTYSTPMVNPPSPAAAVGGSIAGGSPAVTIPIAQTTQGTPGPNSTYAGVFSQLAANAAANGIYNGVNLNQTLGTFSVSPVAQVFTTPKPQSQNTNYGIFVSSVDLWFSTGPVGSEPQFPVQVSIVEVDNGFPTQNVLATCVVDFAQIKYSTVPDSINIGPTLIANNTTVTKFEFADPVYLNPATQYALVLYSESPNYEVYIGTVGNIDVSTGGAGGTRRISQAPSLGGFYKSQNASEWTPIPNEMLMFVLNKAQFAINSPLSFTFNMSPVGNIQPYDSILLHSDDLNFSPCSLTYKIDTILANTFALDPSYTQVLVDQPWNFGNDLKTSQVNSMRRRVLLPGNANSVLAQVTMTTQTPDLSPVLNQEMLHALATTNVVNGGEINPENISIITAGNHINAANIVVTIGAPDLPNGVQATANVLGGGVGLVGNSVVAINIINPGFGYSLSPTITISEPSTPANATAVIGGENGITGGNALARYITRPVVLATGFASGDLRVWVSAIMPVGTAIKAYYKVLGVTDPQPFANVPWIQMASTTPNTFSPDQLTPIPIEFCPALGPNGLPSGQLAYTLNGVQYPLGGQFDTFAIKLVMFAYDTTVTPSLQSFQAAAYPAG